MPHSRNPQEPAGHRPTTPLWNALRSFLHEQANTPVDFERLGKNLWEALPFEERVIYGAIYQRAFPDDTENRQLAIRTALLTDYFKERMATTADLHKLFALDTDTNSVPSTPADTNAGGPYQSGGGANRPPVI